MQFDIALDIELGENIVAADDARNVFSVDDREMADVVADHDVHEILDVVVDISHDHAAGHEIIDRIGIRVGFFHAERADDIHLRQDSDEFRGSVVFGFDHEIIGFETDHLFGRRAERCAGFNGVKTLGFLLFRENFLKFHRAFSFPVEFS